MAFRGRPGAKIVLVVLDRPSHRHLRHSGASHYVGVGAAGITSVYVRCEADSAGPGCIMLAFPLLMTP